MNKRSDTIAAISTPAYVRGGIGIIRISGPDALNIAAAVTKTKKSLDSYLSSTSRKLIHAFLLDESKKPIDEILIAIMPPKRSFTGELAIEMNCHGGTAVVAEALERVMQAGARLAGPGEFTRRAVENGRIDLVKAEAIQELINAKSKISLKTAWRQLSGELTDKYHGIRDRLKSVLIETTFIIDFSAEEEIGHEKQQYIGNLLSVSRREIEEMVISAQKRRYMIQGFWVVISGPTNAGKSSLFNALLSMDRSIVCSIPGTTRDHIAESININGAEVRLIDTAGIRETADEIEMASIRRSKDIIKTSDLEIFVLDSSHLLVEELINKAKRVSDNGGIVVFNKSDLKTSESAEKVLATCSKDNIIKASVKNGIGIDEIKTAISKRVNEAITEESTVISSTRQIELLKVALEALIRAEGIFQNNNKSPEYDVIQLDVEQAVNKLEEITGEITTEEVFDAIFEKFCIGK